MLLWVLSGKFSSHRRAGTSFSLVKCASAAFLAITGATVVRCKDRSLVRGRCVTITFLLFRGLATAGGIAAGGAIRVSGGCADRRGLKAPHAGVMPASQTGDYSDVFVTDADGRKIPWAEASHIDDDQMRDLMHEIVSRLYTFHISCDDPVFLKLAEKWMAVAAKWDEPELDRKFRGTIKYDPGARDG